MVRVGVGVGSGRGWGWRSEFGVGVRGGIGAKIIHDHDREVSAWLPAADRLQKFQYR